MQRKYETEGFYVFNKEKKITMCKFCNVIVDWKRKDTCEKQCKFRVDHKVNRDRCKASGSGIKRQATLEENVQQKKAATEATLAAGGPKSYMKFSSMMGGDPAKTFYEEIGSLFNPRSIIANVKGIDSATLQARIKALLFLCDVPVQQFMECYAATRSSVLETNDTEIDIHPILLSLRDDFLDYSENLVKCIWIPVSNVDSERAFSIYNNIMTDKHTSLGAGNMEIMLSMCFGSESE
ncbi:hypothetical protein PR048_017608 [Dryococelus australis]|uniref:HAT C-terminal dimerisation domain-containing protein n=1 Tax=Dryococelus australis TaxID=614101 RepID=A0ABQ9HA27_9NEOP|nr:hypothetical protein PR048_017608 [Dryococelus australis]